MTAPERRRAQRHAALERANYVRQYRAALRRDLKAGRRSIDSLLRHPPEEILTAKIYDLLLATPKYGRVKVNKILSQCRISPSRTLDGLTQRQRDELLGHIRCVEGARDTARLARSAQYQRDYRAMPRRIAA